MVGSMVGRRRRVVHVAWRWRRRRAPKLVRWRWRRRRAASGRRALGRAADDTAIARAARLAAVLLVTPSLTSKRRCRREAFAALTRAAGVGGAVAELRAPVGAARAEGARRALAKGAVVPIGGRARAPTLAVGVRDVGAVLGRTLLLRGRLTGGAALALAEGAVLSAAAPRLARLVARVVSCARIRGARPLRVVASAVVATLALAG